MVSKKQTVTNLTSQILKICPLLYLCTDLLAAWRPRRVIYGAHERQHSTALCQKLNEEKHDDYNCFKYLFEISQTAVIRFREHILNIVFFFLFTFD